MTGPVYRCGWSACKGTKLVEHPAALCPFTVAGRAAIDRKITDLQHLKSLGRTTS